MVEGTIRDPAMIRRMSCLAALIFGINTYTNNKKLPEAPKTDSPATLGLTISPLVGDGVVNPGETCDDGNVASGDGCSSSGVVEAGFLCHVPGRACSADSACGDGTIDSGEACDDKNTADDGNGCTADCDLSKCGDSALNNERYPSFAQQTYNHGNRFGGDGCSRICTVEPAFACVGEPSRCVISGVSAFNTGVDHRGRMGPGGRLR